MLHLKLFLRVIEMKNVSLKKNLVVPLFNLVSLTLAVGLAAQAAQAADISSFKPATSHTGGVVGATNLDEGRYSFGLNADYAGSLYVNPSRNPDHAVKESVMTSIHMGTGITRDVQLNVGLRATDEIMEPAARAVAMKDVEGYNANENKRTRFAGVSIMPQYQIYKNSDVAMAAALMLESGSMSGETYSLTRSDKVNGGWMLMGSYGQKNDVLLTANTGFRYHKPESIGDYLVRNEWFYRGSASASVFPMVNVFASAEGRRLMKATDNGPMEKGSRKYRPIYSAGYHAGVELDVANTELSLYAGRARDNAEYGIGRRTYGMSLTYKIGDAKMTSNSDESAPAPKVIPASAKTEKKKARGPLGEEEEVNFERDLEKANGASGKNEKRSVEDMDDFEQLEERNRQQKGKAEEASDEVERQIEQVKKIKQERQRREELKRQAEERQRAKREYSDMKNRERKARAVEKEVRKEVDQYPVISDEESNWNGLE